jgi:hypothetical protein
MKRALARMKFATVVMTSLLFFAPALRPAEAAAKVAYRVQAVLSGARVTFSDYDYVQDPFGRGADAVDLRADPTPIKFAPVLIRVQPSTVWGFTGQRTDEYGKVKGAVNLPADVASRVEVGIELSYASLDRNRDRRRRFQVVDGSDESKVIVVSGACGTSVVTRASGDFAQCAIKIDAAGTARENHVHAYLASLDVMQQFLHQAVLLDERVEGWTIVANSPLITGGLRGRTYDQVIRLNRDKGATPQTVAHEWGHAIAKTLNGGTGRADKPFDSCSNYYTCWTYFPTAMSEGWAEFHRAATYSSYSPSFPWTGELNDLVPAYNGFAYLTSVGGRDVPTSAASFCFNCGTLWPTSGDPYDVEHKPLVPEIDWPSGVLFDPEFAPVSYPEAAAMMIPNVAAFFYNIYDARSSYRYVYNPATGSDDVVRDTFTVSYNSMINAMNQMPGGQGGRRDSENIRNFVGYLLTSISERNRARWERGVNANMLMCSVEATP